MALFRRFLVLQALLLWQGGFLFYAAVVVPIGTDTLGAFVQGRVTRHVTDALNAIALVALVVLAWDQVANGDPRGLRRARWVFWAILAAGLAAVAAIHGVIERHVEFAADGRVTDYPAFYFWHRVYLCVSTAQWIAGLGYTIVLLKAWSANPQAANSAPA
jgi:hypothetical protein